MTPNNPKGEPTRPAAGSVTVQLASDVILTVRELTTPSEALRRRAERLLSSLPDDAPDEFRVAVSNLRARADEFRELSQKALEPGSARGVAIHDPAFRHTLGNHLFLVLGICRLWKKKAPAMLLERYLPELEKIQEAADHALNLLNRLRALTGGGGQNAAGAAVTAGRCDPAIARSAIARAPAAAARLREQVGRILVVDDDPLSRDVMREALQEFGHQVVEAGSGAQALQVLADRSAPPIDLILLDVMMPDLDGPAVLERLKADPATRDVPVMMVSALDRLDSVVACLDRGAEDYLVRPCNDLLLQARLAACLDRKRLRDREAAHLQQIDAILHDIFPPDMVAELKATRTVRARRLDHVAVLFTDIVSFTPFCEEHRDRPEYVVEMLQEHVLRLEKATRRYGAQKVKTVGDAFMAVAGLRRSSESPVLALVRSGLEMLEGARSSRPGWQLRVGIHCGPAVAGKLGESQYSFDLWGATVNLAARMESAALAGGITLSPEAYQEVAHCCKAVARDAAIRGVGRMTVYDVQGLLPVAAAEPAAETHIARVDDILAARAEGRPPR